MGRLDRGLDEEELNDDPFRSIDGASGWFVEFRAVSVVSLCSRERGLLCGGPKSACSLLVWLIVAGSMFLCSLSPSRWVSSVFSCSARVDWASS